MDEMELVRKHDLTSVMAPFLDPHMISPLLDFLRQNNVYDMEKISREKIKCVSKTNMITVIEDEYEKLAETVPAVKAEYEQKKDELKKSTDRIFDVLDNPPAEVTLVADFFKNEALVSDLKGAGDLNIECLSSKHGISAEALEIYYKNAKFQYECGMYGDAEIMLSNYLSVSQGANSSVVNATWGKLACHIVQGRWETSKESLKAVKDTIEVRSMAQLDQLKQRAWILHWSLFVHFTQTNSHDAYLDFVTDRAYIQAMQNVCPWLLRYYAVAVLLSPRRKNMLRDLLNEIQNMAYLYSDPILSFIVTLYDTFNIDNTQLRLKEALALMKNDFFLCVHSQKFADLAKMLMCEMYCSMYARVDLEVLADKLELTTDEAEKWMVSMVKNTTSSGSSTANTTEGSSSAPVSTTLNSVANDARIDSAAKHVILAPPTFNIYQQVVDKTRDLTARSAMLNTNMNTLLTEQGILIKNRE